MFTRTLKRLTKTIIYSIGKPHSQANRQSAIMLNKKLHIQ